MASGYNSTFSATSTQHRAVGDGRSYSSLDDGSVDGSWPGPASRSGRNARSESGGSATIGFRAAPSLAPSSGSGGPGSFSSELKSMKTSRSTTPRPDATFRRRGSSNVEPDDLSSTEERQAAIRNKIAKEMKIKTGTENMLEALLAKNPKQTKEQRLKVESELSSSNRKLAELHHELEEELLRAQAPSTPPRSRLSSLFQGSSMRSPSHSNVELDEGQPEDGEAEMESPTYVLAETLQALEIEGMSPDYYVERANSLVELFKRHPTLKYDLAWSVFGLRVQVMLLSDNKEVVAAGYRLTRYAIADRKSLQIIRSLHTDELVILSLVKESKASIEREQALKFVRAFLDVKDGVREISRAVVRTIVSVAEHYEDRLRNISIMTLAEILVKEPELIAYAGGFATLHDALAEGTFGASESLIASFLHVLDTPQSRKHLRGGTELEAVLAPFTDSLADSVRNGRLKSSAKAISAMLKTWPGLVVLARNGGKPLQSLLESLHYPDSQARDLIMELLFDALRIKPPSWSSSFLAGRRLTTYGRVSNLRSETDTKQYRGYYDDNESRFDLTAHFSTLILATLVDAGLSKALSELIEDEEDLSLRRKATLLLTEVLKLAQHSLPQEISSKLQVLPHLLPAAIKFDVDNHDVSMATIYQIESINRTLARSIGFSNGAGRYSVDVDISASLLSSDQSKDKLSPTMDETQFRNAILETHVLNTVNYLKWKWDLIHRIVEGPLTNPKRLDEAIKGSKFMKRLMGFYRPFKYRFSMLPNTKPNQRYVRTGCALMRTLVSIPEGTKYLAENKFLRQVAECLAQVDRMSGLTSSSPLFSREQMANTLSGGYFALLGTLTGDANGLAMMERWHMLNMFYHIIELRDRDDLIQTLLGNMDYTQDSHLRVMLSKALTTGSKDIRIFATKLLRKYAVGNVPLSPQMAIGNADWVVKLLVTQLYDPDVSVCQMAVKILEEACNHRDYLEFVVKCRPSLDHLGEIGAPLLLRFLSTSVGYHYLDGLDYITQEMDDWFLGRNDAYVGLVEAALSRAYVDQPRRGSFVPEDLVDLQDIGLVPPHFYRELARTAEGCKLLEQSGHFSEFAWTIRDFSLDEEDTEVLLKVKGCLWAVGNVGSMELGAPFLEPDIVERIVKIAESAEVLTMRGTAFFVLGLISRSRHGLKVLRDFGWDSAFDQKGNSLGLCLPTDFNKLFLVDFPSHSRNRESKRISQDKFKEAATDSDPTNQKIIKLIVDMGNTVLSKRAAADLHSIKSKQPERFHQPHLFRKALSILESHHFRLPARRFALDLFDKSVMRRIVMEDDSDTDSEVASSQESG
ncbi:Rapamycin-insensitive companion of mTOR, N-term-domain-containing protein [Aspergillus pseudotamarii]|uniref:Rapamycin-insensitive companion of mTOR, N-term-domain-containing protein n=1 Tax=Aspergillus pseudotamarii TaxID=132259 RepID=A0A5N6S8A8_ASPPS|nr:Rapamycin-insensitive companion of mTOR, N-term-domain-containing protein [Aspergillus pseudotamarii]KAE8130906.1 Rapamycin-insensitive companion of mTOR, N-term-domain-containing protein [Aspergillus pseudotamarii]